jgi:hypothetical protein
VAVAVAVATLVVALVAPAVAVVVVRASQAHSIFKHQFLHLRVPPFSGAQAHRWF